MKRVIAICLLLASLAWAAPTQKCKSSTGAGTVASLNCALTSVGANHLLIVILISDSGSSTANFVGQLTLADTLTLTWKAAGSGRWNVRSSMAYIFYANSGGSSGNDTATATFGANTAFTSFYFAEYSLNYTFDPNATQLFFVDPNAASGAQTSNAITVAQDNELLIGTASCTNGPGTLTLGGSGWTLEDSNASDCGKWADQSLGAGTAGNSFTNTWSYSVGTGAVILTAAFGPIVAITEPLHTCNFAQATTTTTTYACTLASVGTSHLLVAMFSGLTATPPTVTDTFTLSWSNISIAWNGTHNDTAWLYYATTGSHSGSETITFTLGSVQTAQTLFAAEYGGNTWSGTVLDASVTAQNVSVSPGTPLSSGTLTTTKPNDLLVSFTDCATPAGTYGPGSSGVTVSSGGVTKRDWEAANATVTVSPCAQWADATAVTPGAYSASWASNHAASPMATMLAAFSPTAAVPRHRPVYY